MTHLTNRIGFITELSPHEATLTLHNSGEYHLRTVHYIGEQPFSIEVVFTDVATGLYDLNVTFHQLSNPIIKKGLTEDKLILCCKKLKLYLRSLNASTLKQEQFMTIFTQFTSLCTGALPSQTSDYVLQANERAQEFTLRDMNTEATHIFTVAQTDNVFPIGASLANGKHCIVNTQDSLLRVLDAR